MTELTVDRAPTSVWALRKDHQDYVRTLPGDRIMARVDGDIITMDRATARLLARRIVECLEQTAVR